MQVDPSIVQIKLQEKNNTLLIFSVSVGNYFRLSLGRLLRQTLEELLAFCGWEIIQPYIDFMAFKVVIPDKLADGHL